MNNMTDEQKEILYNLIKETGYGLFACKKALEFFKWEYKLAKQNIDMINKDLLYTLID